MPDRRLVLDLADLDASAALPRKVDDPTVPVVLVVPSLLRLLQAGWLASLRRRPWSTFGDWLRQALADDAGDARDAGRPEWRYDRVVAGWVDAVGRGRVHLVAGEDPAARTLSRAEVATVEALVAELDELGLTGRNAVDLLQGGIEKLLHAPPVPGAEPGSSGLPADLEQRLAETADAMLAAVDTARVSVAGDRSALLWPTGAGRGDDLVALSAAVDLSIGALERVASWGAPKERA